MSTKEAASSAAGPPDGLSILTTVRPAACASERMPSCVYQWISHGRSSLSVSVDDTNS